MKKNKKRSNHFVSKGLGLADETNEIYSGNSDIGAANIVYNKEILQPETFVNEAGILQKEKKPIEIITPFLNEPEQFAKPVTIAEILESQKTLTPFDITPQEVKIIPQFNNKVGTISPDGTVFEDRVLPVNVGGLIHVLDGEQPDTDENGNTNFKLNLVENPETLTDFKENTITILNFADKSSEVINIIGGSATTEQIENNFKNNVKALIEVNDSIDRGIDIPKEKIDNVIKNTSDAALLLNATDSEIKTDAVLDLVITVDNKVNPEKYFPVKNSVLNESFLDKIVNLIYNNFFKK
jgi:hypothetical protein